MSTTSGVSNTNNSSSSSNTTSSTYTDAFSKLSTDDFLEIIIAELTNQNPLDGSSESTSSKLMNEFLQLYTASSMKDMTNGVESQTEQMTSLYANSLVGSYVEVASDDASDEATGYVTSSQVKDGEVMITVGGTEYKASNIISIINPASLATADAGTTTE